MALINTETFINEDGVEMIRETYDTMVVERPAYVPEPEPETPEATAEELMDILLGVTE